MLRLTNMRAAENRRRGTRVQRAQRRSSIGPELNKRITDFTVSLLGAEGLLTRTGTPSGDPSVPDGHRPRSARFPQGEGQLDRGGTSEIMRNILGERVLGLPGEPRADKNLPWKDIPGADPAGW